ncbi:MAG TPA: hypothetical protein VL043_06725 [Protaetiibacter sp.]|nr:hypothetical protein [Protaetiibacter sp.]
MTSTRPDDLAAVVMRAIVERLSLEPGRIDDVIFGHASQAGEDNRNVARVGALLARLPTSMPGTTVNRRRRHGHRQQLLVAQRRSLGRSPRSGGGARRRTACPPGGWRGTTRSCRGGTPRRGRAGAGRTSTSSSSTRPSPRRVSGACGCGRTSIPGRSGLALVLER